MSISTVRAVVASEMAAETVTYAIRLKLDSLAWRCDPQVLACQTIEYP